MNKLDQIINIKDKIAANTDRFYFENDYSLDEYNKRHDELHAELKVLENE
mgnify:FL=1|tara:strand:- start:277 stop:426 length:150 start_codon:yes stop_codon:yes gene_type:complete